MIKTGAEAILLWVFGASGFGVSALGLDNLVVPAAQVANPQASNGISINEATLLPLGLFLGGLVTTTVVVWKIATHAKDIESQLSSLDKRMNDLEKNGKG